MSSGPAAYALIVLAIITKAAKRKEKNFFIGTTGK
jgi:hypothetical protein